MKKQFHLDFPAKFPGKTTKIGGIIVFHDPSKRVLLLEKENGQFDLPKGHVEENETFLEGALRECWEETGLHHRKNLNVFPYHYISVPSKKWLRFYLGFTPETNIQLTEHVDYRWEPLENISNLLGPDNHFTHVIEAMDALSPF